MSPEVLTAARARMVEEQLVARGIRDPRVLAAMAAVPRHLFVPPEQVAEAYGDHPLPIGYDQTISQPYVVAAMTELLALGPIDRVLEIGAGSGYQAAVLAQLADSVVSLEIVPELVARAQANLQQAGVDRVQVHLADGYLGWPDGAPYPAIILTAAPPMVPPPLLAQLAPGGRMVLPMGTSTQELVLFERDAEGALTERRIFPVRFVPMVGLAEEAA